MPEKTAHELSDVERLGGAALMAEGDVSDAREHARLSRLSKGLVVLIPVLTYMWWRVLTHNPLGLPRMTPRVIEFIPIALLILMLGAALLVPLVGAGRSPHVLYRPEELDTSFADVKGAPVVVEEIVKTLNLFLAHKTFRERMGGNPRRAILFEGPPGTGKTYLAKAMAKEAGVPFLFVSSSAFQSMFYGQTNRKIRSYFKALRKYARQEGGAIGFIEEIDAIGASRGGMGGYDAARGHRRRRQRAADPAPVVRPAPDIRADAGMDGRAGQPGPARGQALEQAPRRRPRTSWSSAPRTALRTWIRRWCDRAGSTARSRSTCPVAPGAGRSSTTTSPRRPTTTSSTTKAVATRSRR